MKLEFRDTLEREAIDLYFEIKDNLERDITVVNAEIKWSLTIVHDTWGIKSFRYELALLLMPIMIDTVTDDGIQHNKVYAEIKFNPSKKENRYECRLYEEQQVDGTWEEEDLVQFPINLQVEERPENETGNRSQVYVKFVELDLTSPEKKLKLTI